MGLFNPYCNSCDGIYCSLDIHFTPTCDNRCPFCIDSKNRSQMQCKPNVDEISKTIISHEDMFNDVLFLGGEPCLYLHDLVECISRIKSETSLKVYVTTSVPYICFKEKDLFFRLVELVDGVNISAQHYDEKIGDEIRGTKSAYDRQKFYNSFPPSIKKKIRVTVNLVKPYFTKKDEILKLLHHYDEMGFGSILIRELQHAPDYFVSFEKTMNMRLPSAYAHGCQSLVDIPGENFTTPIILKRSCSLVESTVEVTWSDILKVATKFFKPRPKNNFAVVWQDGSLRKGW
ncbi:MAG: radical SAM protein [Clostridia bacterium]|nr:radical SAM protein [Clostridia bacterium]